MDTTFNVYDTWTAQNSNSTKDRAIKTGIQVAGGLGTAGVAWVDGQIISGLTKLGSLAGFWGTLGGAAAGVGCTLYIDSKTTPWISETQEKLYEKYGIE